jgi:hypothetical protein
MIKKTFTLSVFQFVIKLMIAQSITYEYDDLGRLMVVKTSKHQQEFFFDDLGNRTSHQVVVNDSLTIIKEVSAFDAVVFPNPVNNELTITLHEPTTGNITLRSMDGKVVLQDVFNGEQKTLDVSNLTSGIYLLELKLSNGDHIVKKIVKNAGLRLMKNK